MRTIQRNKIHYKTVYYSTKKFNFIMSKRSEWSDAEIEKNARNRMNTFVKLLKFGGIWDMRKSRLFGVFSSLYNKILIFWCGLHGFTVYASLCESRNNFDDFVEVMPLCISMTIFYLKLYAFIFRRNEIEDIIQKVRENFFIHGNGLTSENKTIIMSTIKQGKKFTIIYLSWNGFVNVFYGVVSPLLAPVPEMANGTDAIYELPMKIWTPLDLSVSPNYEIVSVYVSLTCIVIGFNFFLTELFIMVLIIYCTGQFELLCDSLSKASTNVKRKLLQEESKSDTLLKIGEIEGEQEVKMEENMSSTLSTKLMHSETEKYLMDCIRHHQSLIEFAARVEDLWKTYFFAQFLTASFLICFLGYKSMTMDMDVNLLKNMGYLGSVIFQLALQCLFGSNLMTESSAVYDAVYSSDWYNQSNKYKFCSRMMIMRAQKPVQIRAGRFGIMSLPLFASMMRSSYSYLALLKQMQEE
ncbi:Odorant receptor 55a [Blattella germanica]|nr:Odorant receptor 55a [Blattella germanica]